MPSAQVHCILQQQLLNGSPFPNAQDTQVHAYLCHQDAFLDLLNAAGIHRVTTSTRSHKHASIGKQASRESPEQPVGNPSL